MERKDVVDFYLKVIKDYETGRFTQEKLADKYNCSIEAISWCTQKYGYHHTKVSEGKKVLTYEDDPEFSELEHMLKKDI